TFHELVTWGQTVRIIENFCNLLQPISSLFPEKKFYLLFFQSVITIPFAIPDAPSGLLMLPCLPSPAFCYTLFLFLIWI
ncbi:hypothetical protein, partial [Klebsiella sp. DNRA6]|uniref:hypothetical protein n=1 Tax=Klebsiella sp. DNRA6 TaxID=2723057 RepID=UPI001B7D0ED3